VLEALTTKINAIDDEVGALQETVDTSAQNVFKAEMMAQNNRLNITSELAGLFEAGQVVDHNALRLYDIGTKAAMVNSTLLNQNDLLTNIDGRVLNVSDEMHKLVGPGGTFSEEGKKNLTMLLDEAKGAYDEMGMLRKGLERAIEDNVTFQNVTAGLSGLVHQDISEELRSEVDELREGLKKLAAASGPWEPVLGR